MPTIIQSLLEHSNGASPVVEDRWVKGGFHVVPTLNDLTKTVKDNPSNALETLWIPVPVRKAGMVALVLETGLMYKLSEVSGLNTWDSISSGGGGGLTPAGVWASGTAYPAGSVVSYQGSSYYASVDTTTTQEPGVDVVWVILAAKGDPGTGTGSGTLTPKGAWSNTAEYVIGDVVTANGASYYSLTGTSGTPNVGHAVTNTTHWGVLAARGDKGDGYRQRGNFNINTTTYLIGDVVRYQGSSYVAQVVMAASPVVGTSVATTLPGADSNWQQLVNGVFQAGEWTASTAYAVGDVVTKGNKTYMCKTNNSDATFTGARWMLLASSIVNRGALAAVPYDVGDIVTFEGQAYICKTAIVSPSVAVIPAAGGTPATANWELLVAKGSGSGASSIKTWTAGSTTLSYTKGDVVIVSGNVYTYNGSSTYGPIASPGLPATPPISGITQWVLTGTTSSGGAGVANKTWPGGSTAGLAATFFAKGDIVVVGADGYYCNVAYPATDIASGTAVPAVPPTSSWTKISTNGSVKTWNDGVLYNKGDIAVIGSDTYYWSGTTAYTVATGVTEPAGADITTNKWIRIANATTVKAWATGTMSSSTPVYNRGDIVVVNNATYVLNATRYPTAAQVNQGSTFPATPPTTSWTKIAVTDLTLTTKVWSSAGYPFTPGCLVTYNGTTYIYTGTTNIASGLTFTAAPVVAANSWQIFVAKGTDGQGVTVKGALALGSYAINDVVTYNGGTYICKAAVVYSATPGTPAGSLALPVAPTALPTATWLRIAQDGTNGTGFTNRGVWLPSTAYAIGDVVTWKGNTYSCIIAHTAGAAQSQSPSGGVHGTASTTPKWRVIVNGIGYQGAFSSTNAEGYDVNDVVTFFGSAYVCIKANPLTANVNTYNATTGDPVTGTSTPVAVYPTSTQSGFLGSTYWKLLAAKGDKGTSFTSRGNWTTGASPAYAIGDVVLHSGSSYVAVAAPSNTEPTLTMTTPWKLVAGGIKVLGAWSSATSYKAGDVVTLGNQTFICVAAAGVAASATVPTDGASWKLIAQSVKNTGLSWATTPGTEYWEIGDIVTYTISGVKTAFTCKVRHLKSASVAPALSGSTQWTPLVSDGAAGTPGTGFTAKGTYAAGTFAPGDVVTLGGNSYVAKRYMAATATGSANGSSAANAVASTAPTGLTSDANWSILSRGVLIKTTLWSASGTQYEAGDVVTTSNGKLWRALQRNVGGSGTDPNTSSTNWEPFVNTNPVKVSAVPTANVTAGDLAFDTTLAELKLAKASNQWVELIHRDSYVPQDLAMFAQLTSSSTGLVAAVIAPRDIWIPLAAGSHVANRINSGQGACTLSIDVSTKAVAATSLGTLSIASGNATVGALTVPSSTLVTAATIVVKGQSISCVKVNKGACISLSVTSAATININLAMALTGYTLV
jgi:hypothetical protein